MSRKWFTKKTWEGHFPEVRYENLTQGPKLGHIEHGRTSPWIKTSNGEA